MSAELPRLRVSVLAFTRTDVRGWVAGTSVSVEVGVGIGVVGERHVL